MGRPHMAWTAWVLQILLVLVHAEDGGQILDAMLGAAPTGPTVLPVATVAPVVPTTPAPIISPNKPQCAVETWSGGSGDVFRSTDSAG
eukprot:g29254.t1